MVLINGFCLHHHLFVVYFSFSKYIIFLLFSSFSDDDLCVLSNFNQTTSIFTLIERNEDEFFSEEDGKISSFLGNWLWKSFLFFQIFGKTLLSTPFLRFCGGNWVKMYYFFFVKER